MSVAEATATTTDPKHRPGTQDPDDHPDSADHSHTEELSHTDANQAREQAGQTQFEVCDVAVQQQLLIE